MPAGRCHAAALASILGYENREGKETHREVEDLMNKTRGILHVLCQLDSKRKVMNERNDRPITRLEGHGSIHILNDKGEVENAT
jgi:hypothetical protein